MHVGAALVSDIYKEMASQGRMGYWKGLEGDPRAASAGAALFASGNAAFFTQLLVSDLPLRYPKLRWVSVESGIGWIPALLEGINFRYREPFAAFPEYPKPSLPSAHEMFKRSMYACFWYEKAGPALLLDEIGEDNVFWETDFPHDTCLYPDPVQTVAENLKGVRPEAVKKILQDNAANLYKIPV
jgi:hypothetical protein